MTKEKIREMIKKKLPKSQKLFLLDPRYASVPKNPIQTEFETEWFFFLFYIYVFYFIFNKIFLFWNLYFVKKLLFFLFSYLWMMKLIFFSRPLQTNMVKLKLNHEKSFLWIMKIIFFESWKNFFLNWAFIWNFQLTTINLFRISVKFQISKRVNRFKFIYIV